VHNYTIKQIAEIVAGVFPGCHVSFGNQGADNRSYRVSFEKIKTKLPEFKCEWDPQRGAQQLHDLFQQIDMTPDVFNNCGFTRLKQRERSLVSADADGRL
jgi:hypothetical protein